VHATFERRRIASALVFHVVFPENFSSVAYERTTSLAVPCFFFIATRTFGVA
jgi:hypothetical protein